MPRAGLDVLLFVNAPLFLLGVVAALCAALAVVLHAASGTQTPDLGWLTAELGSPTTSAPLTRPSAGGFEVSVSGGAVHATRGSTHVDVATLGVDGAWRSHANGTTRATSFGSETITIGPRKTEIYLRVDHHQGSRKWAWRINTDLEPGFLSSGAVVLRGAHPLTIAPVAIYNDAGRNITPASVHWTLKRNGAVSILALRLDDAGIPLPYVIDPSFTIGPYSSAVIADAPLGYYRLADVGSAAADSSGNGNNGTYRVWNGASVPPVVVPHPAGLIDDANLAASFDGASTYVDLSGPLSFRTNTFSIEGWFKTSDASKQMIWRWRGYGNALYVEGGVVKGWFFDATTQYAVQSPLATYADGSRHHAVLTYNGTTLILYVDGAQVASLAVIAVPFYDPAGTIASSPPGSGEPKATIGQDGGGQVFFFNGVIDEVAYYGAALSAARVSAHYRIGSDATPPTATVAASPNGTTNSDGPITVSFNSSDSGSGIATAVYERRTGTLANNACTYGGGFSTIIPTPAAATGGPTTFTEPAGLTSGQCYQYQITVTDVAGNWRSASDEVRVDKVAPVPAISALPSGATNNPGPATITFSVTDAGGSNLASSAIERRTGTLSGGTCTYGGSFAPLVPTTGNSSSGTYIEPSLADGTCYQYRETGTDNATNTASATAEIRDDQTAPIRTSLAVNGTALTIGYNEQLNPAAPAATSFTVTKNGTLQPTPTNVSVSGQNVLLTLANPASSGDSVLVSYTPGVNPIRDLAGNLAASFLNQPATNTSADIVPPSLTSATVNGATLTLGYDEALNTASPAVSHFTVKVNGTAQPAPTNATISGQNVTITLASSVTSADTVTITYVVAGANPIRDLAGNQAAAFTDHAVTNSTPAPPSPSPPPPSNPPAYTGATPSDGTTVGSTDTVTLTSSVTGKWTGMVMRFDPNGGGSSTTTNLPDGSGSSITRTVNATAFGLYTITGHVANDAGGVDFSTHFTVFQGSAANAPPSERNIVSGGGGTLTSSNGAEAVVWTSGTFPSDARLLRIEPAAITTPVGGFTDGGVALNVTLWSSNGSQIHALNGAIEIIFYNASSKDVPEFSNDGGTWSLLTQLPDHSLHADQSEGFWAESAAATVTVHILSRHLTIFGLLRDAKAPTAPSDLGGTIGADGLTLKWQPATDNSGSIAKYAVLVDGQEGLTVSGSQTSATISPFAVDDTHVYQVVAYDAAGNVSPASAGVTQVPNVLGLSLQEATAKIINRGFAVGNVTVQAGSNNSTTTVIGQSPSPPAMATVGSRIDLQVTSGSGQATFVTLMLGARRIFVGGKLYVRVRMKLTLPMRLTAYFSEYDRRWSVIDPGDKRYAQWSRTVGAGARAMRFKLPKGFRFRPSHHYRMELYMRSGTQFIVRRTKVHFFHERRH